MKHRRSVSNSLRVFTLTVPRAGQCRERHDSLYRTGAAANAVTEGDSRVMAYTYRLCVTDDPTNRIPFSRPKNYTPSDFEVHARLDRGVQSRRH